MAEENLKRVIRSVIVLSVVACLPSQPSARQPPPSPPAAHTLPALGARPPILLGFPDGGLSQSTVLADLAAKLAQTVRDVAPDAIVTWGPDGGYGHPDHRLVGAVVTQIVQAGETTRNLYYAALPKSGLRAELLAQLRFPAPLRPVADEYLNVRVPYSPKALAQARASLGCYKS